MNDLPDLRARVERRQKVLDVAVALIGAIPMVLLIVSLVVIR